MEAHKKRPPTKGKKFRRKKEVGVHMNQRFFRWKIILGSLVAGLMTTSETSYQAIQASTSEGLVQLWQEIPEGQRKPKNVSEAELREKLYCKVNHDLIGGQGINEYDTYINSCYVDDAYYLGETDGSYKVLISGYEGWVKKSENKTVTLKFYVDKNEREVSTNKAGEWKTYTYTVKTVANLIPYSENQTYTFPKGIKANSTEGYVKNASDFDEEAPLLEKVGTWLGLKKTSTKTVKSPSFYASENGTLIHYIAKDITKEGSYSSVTIGKAPTWMKDGKAYFSYDGIYFYENLADIQVFGEGAVNEGAPFFNYYQYVPIRSNSNITEADINFYLKQKGYTSKATSYPAKATQSQLFDEGSSFETAQSRYHINGALQFSMAVHESAWGRSSLSIRKNNLFGMNAIDSNPGEAASTFSSPSEAIQYHAERYLSWGYSDPLGDSRYYGFYLGNKSGGMNVKYASDPFWGEKIAGHYYNLDKVSGYRDLDSTSFGVIMYEAGVPIYQEPNTSSRVLYQTKNGKTNTRLAYYPLIITGETDEFYEVLLDTPIGENGTPVYNSTYSEEKAKGYVKKEFIHYRNTGESLGTPTRVESDYRPSDEGVPSTNPSSSLQEQPATEGESDATTDKALLGEGKVLIEGLSVRSEPSARGQVIGRLSKNDIIDVIGQEGKWIMFDFQGETAYISEAYVRLEQATAQEELKTEQAAAPIARNSSKNKEVIDIGYVTVNTLNVRSDASMSGNEIGAVYKGEKVEIVGQKGPFYEINFKNGTGFVSSQYISMSPIAEDEDDSTEDNTDKEDNMDTPTVVIQLGYVTTNSLHLNVYKDLSDTSSSKVIGTLKHGTEVEILRDEGEMYLIKYNGGHGYVEKKYISSSKPAELPNSNNSSNQNNSTNGNSNNNGSNNSSGTSTDNNTENNQSNNNTENNNQNQSGGSSIIDDWISNNSNNSTSEPLTEEEIILPNEEGYVFEAKKDLGGAKYHFVKSKLEDGVLYLIGRVSTDIEDLLVDKSIKKNFLIVDTASQGIIKRVELNYQAATNLLMDGNDMYKFELGFPLQKLPIGIYDLKMLLDKNGEQTTTNLYEKELVGQTMIFDGRIYKIQENKTDEGIKTMQLTVMPYIEEQQDLETEEVAEEEVTEDVAEEQEEVKEEKQGFFSKMMDSVKKFFSNIGQTILGWFGLGEKEEAQDMGDLLDTPSSEVTEEAGQETPDNTFEIITDESSSQTVTNEE